jgi:hypothetical protein
MIFLRLLIVAFPAVMGFWSYTTGHIYGASILWIVAAVLFLILFLERIVRGIPKPLDMPEKTLIPQKDEPSSKRQYVDFQQSTEQNCF